MIGPDGTVYAGNASDQPKVAFDDRAQTLTRLRGARVEVDSRRVLRVLFGGVVIGLVALIVALFVGGANTNAQINELHDRGVPVTATISGCLGLLGGSGSNAAGYTCRGNFTVNGHRYKEIIPGNVLLEPGTKVPSIVVSNDPRLISPVTAVKHERASSHVFVLPSVLAGALLLILMAAFLLKRRGARLA